MFLRLAQRIIADVQSDHAHQLQRVAFPDDSGADSIVKVHRSVIQMIFEVNVDRVAPERVNDFRQRQIVCGHDADRFVFNQLLDDAFRADSTVVRVRSLQDFVQQKQQRRGLAGSFDNRLDTRDDRIKQRRSLLQRIVHPHG